MRRDCGSHDADGRDAWHLSKELISVADSAVVHLTRKEAGDNADVTDAIMVSAVLNELTETHSSSDD